MQRVISAHAHWEKGELSTRYPRAPVAVLFGVEVYDQALNATQTYDIRERREAAEQERRMREAQGATPPAAVTPRRRPTRR